MERTRELPTHISKNEWRKRMNVSAALIISACGWMRFGAFQYSEKYIAKANLIIEKAKKEGYFEIGENDNGRRD